MELWDTINYISDRVKGITPDMSTVKRAGGAAYNFTSPSITKINQVVVNGIKKTHQYQPDDETVANIKLFTTTLAKNTGTYAVKEGYKHVPGATVAIKLLSDTVKDVKQEINKDTTSHSESSTVNSKLTNQHADQGGSEQTKIARSRM